MHKFHITAIQQALRNAGFHYYEPTGLWDQQTTDSYRQWHATVLLNTEAHTLQQPSCISQVCAELLELAGIDLDDDLDVSDEDDNVDSDADDDSDEPGDDEDEPTGKGEDDSEGDDTDPVDPATPTEGSVIISTGEGAVVTTVDQLQEGFQLSPEELAKINDAPGNQQQQSDEQDQQQQEESGSHDQQEEHQDSDHDEQEEQQQEEPAAPAEPVAPKLTKAQQRKLDAAKKAAEDAKAVE